MECDQICSLPQSFTTVPFAATKVALAEVADGLESNKTHRIAVDLEVNNFVGKEVTITVVDEFVDRFCCWARQQAAGRMPAIPLRK